MTIYGKLVNVLDKEEFRIKLEEINRLVELKDYKEAMNVVDSIDWRRVKNVRTLCVVGEIYAANKRYEDSKEIFLLAYHRAPIGKNILYRLIEVSLKMEDIEEAMEFYEEYVEVAPNDHTQYILKYKIYKAKNASDEELIKILEDYKNKEFTERWSYELAKLYYKAGMKDECLKLCDEMVLWFNDGKYVMKALELKLRLGELKGEEKEKYEQQFTPTLVTADDLKELKENEEELKEESSSSEKIPVIESIRMDQRDINNAESLQEKISKGLRDIFGSMKKEKDIAETDEEQTKEEKEEMESSINTKETFIDVPDLEPEKVSHRVNGAVEIKEEKPVEEIVKMPELEIPESMKKVEVQEEQKEVEEQEEIKEEPKAEFDFNFNLEDTILAAATAQGIEIPKEPVSKPVEKELVKEESVDVIGETKEMPDLSAVEEEEEFSEEDLRLAEEEFLKGPAERTVEETETKEEEVQVKPEGMNTEVFNFQQEIKKILGEEEEFTTNIEFASEEDETDEFKSFEEEEELEKFIESIQPENKRSKDEIIPRTDKLSEEELKLFTYFVKVPGMKEQLVDALYDVQLAAADKTSKTGNVIIMGGKETGKTRLIAALIPAICKELNMEASKVAYVFAEQINGKDIASIVEKLSGGFLVIENANQLTQSTAEQLNKAMEFRTDGLTVIIEDEKIGMRKFMAKYPRLAKKFTSMINIPVFMNDELVEFAKVYANENGYNINQMGMLALYNSIGENQKQDEPMNIGVVKNLVDAAIAKSKGGFLKSRKKKTDVDGFMVLTEKDFN